MYDPAIARAIAQHSEPIPRTAKAILRCMADFADAEGKGIFPSINVITKHSGFGRSAIKLAIAWLLQNGYLLADGKHGSVNCYQLGLGKLGLPDKHPKPSPVLALPAANGHHPQLSAVAMAFAREEGLPIPS